MFLDLHKYSKTIGVMSSFLRGPGETPSGKASSVRHDPDLSELHHFRASTQARRDTLDDEMRVSENFGKCQKYISKFYSRTFFFFGSGQKRVQDSESRRFEHE